MSHQPLLFHARKNGHLAHLRDFLRIMELNSKDSLFLDILSNIQEKHVTIAKYKFKIFVGF